MVFQPAGWQHICSDITLITECINRVGIFSKTVHRKSYILKAPFPKFKIFVGVTPSL